VTPLEGLTRNYRTAFLAYLSRREESGLHRAYEIGRSAVTEGLNLLDLVRVHHEVLLEVLRETPAEELAGVATAAAEFLMEVLATSEMARRAFVKSTASAE
jgi:Phosphoserine phosphatase RsbU, N-terminal domain